MSGAPRMLELQQLRPGMALAEDVRDPGGALLLACGTPLDDAALLSLRCWGIERLLVAEADPAAAIRQAQARLDTLFRKSRGQPAGDALLQSLSRYRQENAQ